MVFPNSPETTEIAKRALHRKRIEYSEDALLAALEAGSDRNAVYWATIALRDVGTLRAVPALQNLLHYPMQDVKDCSLLTIAHLSGPAATEFYVHALRDKRTRKLYPMWAIRVAADERAVEAVLEYVDRVLKRLERSTPADPGDAYLDGLEYLSRFHETEPRIETVFARVRRVWSRLPVGAQTRLAAS
ncbi:MAG TPA: hypothetical protein VLN49_25305, partial [Gemmatimonadaceae bacterium]|nr:hypothetical protein [Gemmatimonadaceae bacterium]